MLNLNNIPKYADFKYWFIRNRDVFNVVSKDTNECIYMLIETDEGIKVSSVLDDEESIADFSSIADDFERFKERPEYWVELKFDMNLDPQYMIDFYQNVLSGVALRRTYENIMHNSIATESSDPDIALLSIQKMLHWLDNTDFYRAPSSTRFHDSYKHGLLYHSLQVMNNILDLSMIPKFSSVSTNSSILVALMHDWCKINIYEFYKRNVKDEATGQWNQVDAYRRNDSNIPFGHGVQSMYMASKMCNLSVDEALAIRWHMGVWNVCQSEYNDLQHANECYPLVHMLQFADQLAITKY